MLDVGGLERERTVWTRIRFEHDAVCNSATGDGMKTVCPALCAGLQGRGG